MASSRRPRASNDSVVLYNTMDVNGHWIPIKISKGVWILLQSPTRKRKQPKGDDFVQSWKARVLDFKLSPGQKSVSEILVEHVYMHKELQLPPTTNIPRFRPNYVYPSSYTEWEPAKSVKGIFDVVHGDIGEMQYQGRKHTSLANAGIFFYDAKYHPPMQNERYGKIEPLELPNLSDLSWPLPDSSISEGFRCRIYNDIQCSMKPNTGGKKVRLSWFMPFCIFADFFSKAKVRRTKTMFLINNLTTENISELLDIGWDVKEIEGNHCKISLKSISFRYIIGKQSLNMTFWYLRQYLLQGKLVAMDQDLDDGSHSPLMNIDVFLNDEIITNIPISGTSTLRQLRTDIYNEDINIPNDFNFYINNKKVHFNL